MSKPHRTLYDSVSYPLVTLNSMIADDIGDGDVLCEMSVVSLLDTLPYVTTLSRPFLYSNTSVRRRARASFIAVCKKVRTADKTREHTRGEGFGESPKLVNIFDISGPRGISWIFSVSSWLPVRPPVRPSSTAGGGNVVAVEVLPSAVEVEVSAFVFCVFVGALSILTIRARAKSSISLKLSYKVLAKPVWVNVRKNPNKIFVLCFHLNPGPEIQATKVCRVPLITGVT